MIPRKISKIIRIMLVSFSILFFSSILSLILYNTYPSLVLFNNGESLAAVELPERHLVFNEAVNAKDRDTAIIQIYAARTWGWKGALAVHTWITTKRNNESIYRTYQVIGWRYLYGQKSPLVVTKSVDPIKSWYGNPATLLLELKGEQVDQVIEKIKKAIREYPYRDTYTTWPGPNSNTFTAYVARRVPELNLDLPSTAIGKDYRSLNQMFGSAPSNTGIQGNVFGLFGFTLGAEEGLEINVLSLNFELDIFDLAVEIPGFGRIGKSLGDEN